jgi:hypothetical protein
MPKAPPKKLRWERVILALLILGGGIAALVYYGFMK